MNIIINLIAWKRPYYFKEVVEALEKCEGVERFSINLFVDGGHPSKTKEQVSIFMDSSLSNLKHEIYAHLENLGCAGNAGYAFNTSFKQGCDAIITLEDDTVPSKDYLIFMEWALNKFKDDKDVFSVTGYIPRFKKDFSDEGVKNAYCKDKYFGCYGWGTWRRIYDEIKSDWFGISWKRGVSGHDKYGKEFMDIVNVKPTGSWAWPMNNFWRKGRFHIWPDVSRIQNIGVEDGSFVHKINLSLEYWSETHTDKKTYTEYIFKEIENGN